MPRVVAIGGGHGLAACLRAIRRYTSTVTAVVSVADDGGSTGRLRAASDRPAPGDLRKCLVALAEDGPLARAMEHRFGEGDLEGHAFGNLLIAALTEVGEPLVGALDEIGRLLGCVGRVLPSTCDAVSLVGTTSDGARIRGQALMSRTEGLATVALDPAAPSATPEALQAVAEADQVVVGPGSLFTSVLAALAVPELAAAVAARSDRLVYVCNVRPQPGETAGYGVADHVAALHRQGIRPARVLFDPGTIGGADGVEGAVAAAVASEGGRRHDEARLAEALAALLLPADPR